jgi:Tol biopolymer transport system component
VVNAAFACGTTTCTATVTKPGGGTVNVANGAPVPTDVEGGYTFSVTSADGAGHTATLTRRYTVTPIASLSGKIVFTRSNHIWAINPDGTGLVQITTGSGLDDQASLSPDGTRIVFARRSTASGPSQLWLTDADGRNAVQLTNTGDNTAPAWSPDGTLIAFSSNRTGSQGYDIWTLNPNTGTLVNLTNTAGDDLTPAWSPASAKLIAFSSNRKKSEFEIFTMTTTGGSVTQLTNDPATDTEPSYSPDGTKIAFSSNRATSGTPNGFEIYVMGAPNGSSQNRLTTLAGDDRAPAWISNTKIVFSSAQLAGLATVAPTGGASTKIPNTAAGDANPD